ncbi:hypothetical protein V3C99_013980 [Haemonchus contortus]
MYTSQPPVTAATPRTATPPQLFLGSRRVFAAAWYLTLYTFSITLHLAFIVGARKLRGWKANFSFTLLLYLSTMALLYLTTHMIGTITTLLYMDWFKYQILWILLGAFAYAAIFTVILTDLVIALHRLIYTVWPLIGGNHISVLSAKVTLLALGVIFVLFVVLLNTNLVGVRWVGSLMAFDAIRTRSVRLFQMINKVFNYLNGIVNSITYAMLFFVLVKKKMLSFSRNHELRVTLQVSIMMVEEVGFFVYWEFFPIHAQFGADIDIVIAESALMLFLDVLILPYLVLNRNIHSELKRVLGLQKKNTTTLLWLRSRVDVVTRAP